eukprot:2856078-Pyramimonas_sp.AAC.1
MLASWPGRAKDDLQDGSRYPKMPHDGAHDAPRGPKNAPRRLQMAKEFPQEVLKRPKSFQNLWKINVFWLSRRGLKIAPRWPKRAPRALHRLPKALQEDPKRRPGGPRRPQQAPKRPPRGSSD